MLLPLLAFSPLLSLFSAILPIFPPRTCTLLLPFAPSTAFFLSLHHVSQFNLFLFCCFFFFPLQFFLFPASVVFFSVSHTHTPSLSLSFFCLVAKKKKHLCFFFFNMYFILFTLVFSLFFLNTSSLFYTLLHEGVK